MIQSKQIKIYRAALLSLFAIFSVAICFILPSGDDWWCSSPSHDCNWKNYLPHYEYGYVVNGLWRPFPVLIRNILGYFPNLFHLIDHLLTILFYILSAFMVDKLCKLLEISEKSRLCVFAFMLFAPISMATLLSVDGYGQSASTFFGLWSVVVFYQNKGFKKYFKWIILVFIGTFIKESGLVWLVATPAMSLIISKKNVIIDKELIKNVAVGICFVAIYFLARNLLMQKATAILVSDYEMNLSAESFIKNYLLIFSGCLTSTDTLALFLKPQNFTIAAVTFFLGLPILIITIWLLFSALKNKNTYRKYLLFIFLIICVSSPHVITTCCTEMYVYATIPIIALMIVCLFKDIEFQHYKFIEIALICYFAAALFVDIHKYVCIYDTGIKGRNLALKIDKMIQEKPVNVLILNVKSDEPHYSVYKHPVFIAYGRGYASLALNDYQYPKHICYYYVDAANNYDNIIREVIENNSNTDFDNIWIIDKEDVTIVKSKGI